MNNRRVLKLELLILASVLANDCLAIAIEKSEPTEGHKSDNLACRTTGPLSSFLIYKQP
jgi:hypothetical protein